MSFGQDFDIAGASDPMLADSEILAVAVEVLTSLDVGEFTVKVGRQFHRERCAVLTQVWGSQVNHRKVLDGVFDLCGVPPKDIRAISSSVDKLDKVGPRFE